MIPLQNHRQQHLGACLMAGLPDDYASTAGIWEGDCVFMALPADPELLEDPSLFILRRHDHVEAGEHAITVTNDGSTVSLLATAPNGEQLFIRLPASGPGVWGLVTATGEEPLGHAVRVAKERDSPGKLNKNS